MTWEIYYFGAGELEVSLSNDVVEQCRLFLSTRIGKDFGVWLFDSLVISLITSSMKRLKF